MPSSVKSCLGLSLKSWFTKFDTEVTTGLVICLVCSMICVYIKLSKRCVHFFEDWQFIFIAVIHVIVYETIGLFFSFILRTLCSARYVYCKKNITPLKWNTIFFRIVDQLNFSIYKQQCQHVCSIITRCFVLLHVLMYYKYHPIDSSISLHLIKCFRPIRFNHFYQE